MENQIENHIENAQKPHLRVLITGGLGFIGSHCAIQFSRSGNEVLVVDNLSRPKGNLSEAAYSYNPQFFTQNYPSIQQKIADVREKNILEEIFKEFEPDYILHAAGQTSAVGSVENPRDDFENNVIGLYNTLEAARTTESVKGFAYLSTNKVYSNRTNSISLEIKNSRYVPTDISFLGFDETMDIDQGKHTPYGVSKLAGDLYVQEYGQLYGLTTGVFRMSCIYGPRQFGFLEQGWVAYLLLNVIKNHPIQIFGDGKQVRDILFIEDLARLYEKFGYLSTQRPNAFMKHSNVFNIGGGKERSISLEEMMHLMKKISQKDFSVEYFPERAGDQKYFVADISKVKKDLDWAPQITVEQGVKATYDWLYAHQTLFK